MGMIITKYTLVQQTPMIHFQHGESGACLRGSDVKPKLDRFLLAQLSKQSSDTNLDGFSFAKARHWLLGDGSRPALNYKIRFFFDNVNDRKNRQTSHDIDNELQKTDNPSFQKPKTEICRSYFSNMVETQGLSLDERKDKIRDEYRETVLYSSPIQMQVICLNESLRAFIQAHVPAFFLLHNFGTRSNKGFGSFMVQQINGHPITLDIHAEILKYFPEPFYIIRYQRHDQQKQMDDIADIYQIMKSGMNDVPSGAYLRAYIYEYMHKQVPAIGNEKAWMKKNRLVPIICRPGHEGDSEMHKLHGVPDTNYRYVRAVLGIGDNVSYINKLLPDGKIDKTGGRTTIKIKCKVADIGRFASPILFKVIGNETFVLPYQPNKVILDQAFDITSPLNVGHHQIQTPANFDMRDFMASYAKHINSIAVQTELAKLRRPHFTGRLIQCWEGCETIV